MKKIKIMLMSLAVLAIVGGALAFKAKGTLKYCTTFAQQDEQGAYFCPQPAIGNACPFLQNFTTTSAEVVPICTTVTNGTATPCAGVTKCTILLKTTPDL